jgi:hypothetical protein
VFKQLKATAGQPLTKPSGAPSSKPHNYLVKDEPYSSSQEPSKKRDVKASFKVVDHEIKGKLVEDDLHGSDSTLT